MTSFHNGGHIKSSGKTYREKVTENQNPPNTISILEDANVTRTLSLVQDNPNTYSGTAIPSPAERQTLVYPKSTDPKCKSEEECECSKWYCVTSLVDGEQKCLRLTARDALAYYPGVIGHDTEEECKSNCGYKWYCVSWPLGGKKCRLLRTDSLDAQELTGYDTESECISEACTRKYYCLPNPNYGPNTGLGGITDLPFICQLKYSSDPDVQGLTGYDTPEECETYCATKYYCLFDPITEAYSCEEKLVTDPSVVGKTPYNSEEECAAACYYNQSQYFNIIP